jgi:hypothetical protein
MHFTRGQRDSWTETTKENPFNRWLDAEIRDVNGALDLDLLHAVALRYGVDRRLQYAHLNPGQQRMNIGNMLRRVVPQSVFGGQATAELTPKTMSPVSSTTAPPPARPAFVAGASVRQLLEMHGQIMDELRDRKVVRTANAPGGDYAELLFANAFGWALAGNSASGHDAVDADGARYQIKSRRLSRPGASRQLSALRNLPDKKFDVLAGVIFESDYRVRRAALVPLVARSGEALVVDDCEGDGAAWRQDRSLARRPKADPPSAGGGRRSSGSCRMQST